MHLPPRIVRLYFAVWLACWILISAFHHHWWIYFLLWPASVFTIVFSAYWTNNPGILGKDARTGKLHKGFVILLFPFFATVWTTWWFQSRKSKEPVYSKIDKDLYLGRFNQSHEFLPLQSPVLLIDMTCEFSEPDCLLQRTTYRCFPVLDGHYPLNELEYYNLIMEAYCWRGPVAVHCAQGHGRSGAIAVILVIMKGHASTVDEAVLYLRRIRPGVKLHPGQRAVVERTLEIWRDRGSLYF